MIDERKLLASLLKSRKVWESLAAEINAQDLSPEGASIFGLVADFYTTDPEAKSCDAKILESRIDRTVVSNKNADILKAALASLHTMDVSAINVAQEALELRKDGLGHKIASTLAGGKYNPLLKDWMGEYQRLDDAVESLADTASDEDEYVGTSAADLTKKSFSKEGLIQLYPKVLNDQIDGGVRGGHHILVFAPTEMGKSLFVLNMCYGFLRQNLKVLYVGNEDPAPDMLMRMMTRLTGMNKYEIEAEPDKADNILSKRNWRNFTFASLSPGTFPKIRSLVDKYTPQVVVLDQLRNIDVQTDSRTQALERAATEARNLAKRYDVPVISVAQAGDSASGKTILNRGDVDGSNVGIPGQTDLMIGIGATQEMEERDLRTLSFPKNKLSGRHTPIQVQIDPFLSRVVE